MAQIMPKLHLAFGVAESPEGDGLYGSPPWRSFCAYKRNQNTLGAAPQDPDASVHPARKAKATASRSGIRRRL